MLPRPASCFPPMGEEACPRRAGYQQLTTPSLQRLNTPTRPPLLCQPSLRTVLPGYMARGFRPSLVRLLRRTLLPLCSFRSHLFEESFRDSYSQTSSSPPGPTQALYLSLPRGPKDQLYIISAQILLILQTVSAFCTAACLISI